MKEVFNSRKIDPSEQAWDRLAQRLDNAQKKRKRLPYVFWVAAAAAMVLAVVLYPAMVQNTIPQAVDQQLVTTPDQDNIDAQTIAPTEDVAVQPVNKTENTIRSANEPLTPIPTGIVKKSIQKSVKEVVADLASTSSRLKSTADQNEPLNPLKNKTDSKLSVINVVALETVVDTHVSDGKIDPDAEIDRLLQDAMARIEQSDTTNHDTAGIDAAQLLRETEWDINYEKRHRLENSVKKGLNNLAEYALVQLHIKEVP